MSALLSVFSGFSFGLNSSRFLLTLEEHGVDNHSSICILHILSDLGQLAVRRLGCPLVDGVYRTLLVPEVYF